MQVLEARFHPHSKTKRGLSVPVALIFCKGPRATVELLLVDTRSTRPFDVTTLAKKLRYLIEHSLPDPYEQLIRLRSDYWSFEQVELDGQRDARAALT